MQAHIQAIAEFLKNVLPDTPFSSRLKSSPLSTTKTSGRQTEEKEEALPSPANASTSKAVVYETPSFPELEDHDDYDDDDDNGNFDEKDVQAFGGENGGTIASPYIV